MDVPDALRAVVGIALVAFAPGYAWTRLLLPQLEGGLERLVASIVLSIALMALVLFAASTVLGMRVNAVNAGLSAVALILLAWGASAWRPTTSRPDRP